MCTRLGFLLVFNGASSLYCSRSSAREGTDSALEAAASFAVVEAVWRCCCCFCTHAGSRKHITAALAQSAERKEADAVGPRAAKVRASWDSPACPLNMARSLTTDDVRVAVNFELRKNAVRQIKQCTRSRESTGCKFHFLVAPGVEQKATGGHSSRNYNNPF